MKLTRYLVVGVAIALMSCGGDESSGTTDTGGDMASDMVSDGGSDMATDMSVVDMSDMQNDAGPLCGNGQLDDGELCDGTIFRDADTCGSFGLPDGDVSCTETCQVDTTGCAVCDDNICSDGETAVSCPADCAVTSISAGRTHTCATLIDGTLWCWGAREGHGMGGTSDTNVPVRVPLATDNVTQVAVGQHHTCFVRSDDSIWCFGKNGFGEAGPSDDYHVFPPERVMDGTFVAVGDNHSCGVGPTGDVSCWGRGDHGQRGDGEFSTRQSAVEAITSQRVNTTRLAVGGHVSCELLESLKVRCWGDNSRGQIPIVGTQVMLRTDLWQDDPVTVADLLQLQLYDVAIGGEHACYSVQNRYDTSQKLMLCVGSNSYGQVGVEASTDVVTINGQIMGDLSPVAAGFGYTCAEDNSDSASPQLKCWGDNYFGQLGDGTTDARHAQLPVSGISDVAAISGGHDHVCAVLPDGTARCWGRNREGQLGNGSEERSHHTPVSPLRFGPGGAQ